MYSRCLRGGYNLNTLAVRRGLIEDFEFSVSKTKPTTLQTGRDEPKTNNRIFKEKKKLEMARTADL